MILLFCGQANYSHGFHYHDMMGHLVYYELVSFFFNFSPKFLPDFIFVLNFQLLWVTSNRNAPFIVSASLEC